MFCTSAQRICVIGAGWDSQGKLTLPAKGGGTRGGSDIDSASTIFVIADSAAVKKTMWLNRRAIILQQAQQMGDIVAVKIGEHDNFADPETKLLIIKTWRRHLWYVHNLPGDMPP